MKVRVFHLAHNIKEFKDIKIIRIVSNDYSLLIMQDNMPVCGEINGMLALNSNEIDLEFNNLKAFYTYRNNEFDLIIKRA